jgi:NAD(P)-dependent dehydrogenase (short-subunit alcohol dehydrogenase family)
VAQAALWGLGRAIGIEHPGLWGGLIDLDPADVFNPALLSALLSSESESMVALRGGAQKFVPRIVRAGDRAGLAGASARLRFAAEASYLVTGGLGGLGLRLAAWLLERGAGAVALLGRSEPVTGALEGLPEGRVRVLRGDVSRREDVAAALAQIQQSMPPLRGVFHLAGALDDGRLLDQDIERFYNAGTGKAEGAWHLHELTRDLALDHFVMFSSMASLVTTHGQGNYASANSVADALAHLRRAESRAALSVNWGPWARIGHAATDYGRGAHERLAQLGVKALSPDTSLAALERLMMTDVTQAAVIDVDWQRLALADPAAAAAPLLSELFAASPAVAAASAVETALVKDLKAGAMTGRLEKVTAVLARMLAQVLRLADAQAISRTRAFMEMGLDSILALELTRQISAVFGRSFSATLLFKCPNLESLAPFLLSAVLPEREEETRTAGSSRPPGEESDSQAAKRLAGGKPRSAPTLASAGTATEDTAGSGVGSAARAEGAESELSEAELSELILEEIGSR